ncbi:hypothetical protein [Acinetobacter phage P577]|uniref:hypothetical protein n=1 Tax=Acinetobacter phage YMC13/03/R2096 TaxID=1560342 RepID=UPI00052A8B91|nr:hypothetical protein ACQ36_gp033 [Acinetobacter phage YMC13/03/R2096]AIW02767.1 hypothetical protein BPABA577_00330 [Acinetobacter phage YMC13/03/R2096]WNT46258.1 hypothetical protein [Acinetobacter phage P577]
MLVFKTLVLDFLTGLVGSLLKNWKLALISFLILFSVLYTSHLKGELKDAKTDLDTQKAYHSAYVQAYEKEFQKRYAEVVHINKRLVKDLEEVNGQIERKNQEVEATYADNRALLDELTRRLSKQQDSGTKGGGWVTTDSSVPATKATEPESTSRSFIECAQELTEMGREADSLAIDLQAVIQSHNNYLTEIEILNSSNLNGNSKELDKRD